MTRSEVIAAKRRLLRLRFQLDRYTRQGWPPVAPKVARVQADIAELEAKLLREGATSWR